MKNIAVYSLKGGVGKTITTATLAHLYAVGEKRKGNVLLVDADSQGNLTQYFSRYSKDDCGLHKVLEYDNCSVNWHTIGTNYSTIDIVTGGMQLYEDDRKLFKSGRTDKIREMVQLYATSKNEHYDLCLIDCAPALNMLTINALCAADYVIIPIRVDAFSSNGLVELENQLSGIRTINKQLQIAGIVITHYQHTDIFDDAVHLIEEHFPVFKTKINYSKHISRSTLINKPLPDMSARIWPTVQYRRLLNEICVRIGQVM